MTRHLELLLIGLILGRAGNLYLADRISGHDLDRLASYWRRNAKIAGWR